MEEYKTTGRKGETVYAVEYDGHEYKRYPNGKHPNYYVFKWKCGGTYHQELLHHAVWKNHNGDIPKGKVIHHIDGNPLNNDISNLMAVTISEHAILHDKLKGFQTKENAEKVWYSKENWKERRKKAGFTQRELADRMHVTRSTVADWEADISKPEYSQIPVLCTLLDIRAYELFRLPPENGLSTLEKRIVGNLRSLSPANRRVVDKMINAMAEEELRNPEQPVSD